MLHHGGVGPMTEPAESAVQITERSSAKVHSPERQKSRRSCARKTAAVHDCEPRHASFDTSGVGADESRNRREGRHPDAIDPAHVEERGVTWELGGERDG